MLITASNQPVNKCY